MVCQPALKEAFKPLVYPLIQVIDSVVNLIPTARYYPLRFHCVDMYIQIISATDMYIPVAPLLLDVIEVRALGADDLVEREVHGEAVEHIEAPGAELLHPPVEDAAGVAGGAGRGRDEGDCVADRLPPATGEERGVSRVGVPHRPFSEELLEEVQSEPVEQCHEGVVPEVG